jgi:tryptophan synthase beta chain
MKPSLKAAERDTLLAACLEGSLPDARGRFGPFGGRYVPETLVPAFERLEEGVRRYLHEEAFQAEFRR